MSYISNDEMAQIFKNLANKNQGETCRHCRYRRRFALNQYSNKVVQCCEKQPSKHSNSGYKSIKVTDPACPLFEKGGEK